MTRRPAINAVERSGQPVRIVGGKTVEILRHVPVHGSTPNETVEPASLTNGDAGSLFELLA